MREGFKKAQIIVLTGAPKGSISQKLMVVVFTNYYLQDTVAFSCRSLGYQKHPVTRLLLVW